MTKIKKGIGLKDTLFLIIALLLIAMLAIKMIEKDLFSITILAINSVLMLLVFLILRKQRENMLRELEQDLTKKVEEIKKRGKGVKRKKEP